MMLRNTLLKRALVVFTAISMYCMSAAADRHLEVGGYLTTTTVLDDSFEFFTTDYMVLDHWGLDLRAEVLEIRDTLHLLPFVSYRYTSTNGSPMLTYEPMDTALSMHDVDAGLRGRVWFLPWLGAYTQLYTGISRVFMSGEINNGGESGMLNEYRDKSTEWNIGAGLGVEVRLSPWLLEKSNIRRFNFGGELGVGFIKRTETKFNPTLEGGDDLSLTNVHTTQFGSVDLSGVVFQMGLTISFL